jgi:dolichol-phosphate mannosyltransferase
MSLLSIIIPSYNEESNIANTAKVLAEVLETAEIEYELIFISDGSQDDTYNTILKEAKKNPRVKGAEFSRNFGKEASIFAGLQLALGDACIVIDCDLQHPPEVIPHMYKLWKEGFEVVEGMKTDRGKESVFHRLFVNIFYGIMSRLIKIDMNASSDFKLLDRKVINVLLGLTEKNTFFRALTFWAGFKSTTIAYEVKERQFGISKWSFFSLMKYAITNTTSFTTVPLQIITFGGVGSIFFSIIIAIQTLIRYFMGQSVEGFTTVILLILIIGGLIMLSLGIIGHYISRIYEEVKGRPKYIIRQVTDNVHGNILGESK